MRVQQEIHKSAAAMNPRDVLETVLTFPVWGLAWLLGRIARILWLIFAYLLQSVAVGWRKGWRE